MIVKLDYNGESIDLDDSGFEPPSFGSYLRAAINRRELSPEDVARKSEIGASKLSEILNDKVALDKPTARKLEKVFPRCADLFLKVQRFDHYYKQYGVMRPDSPIKRAVIERQSRKAHAAASPSPL